MKSSIDWNEQWARFSEDFRDGTAHIDLQRFRSPHTLLLSPGPGFGDLSHPTTYLMLSLMAGWLDHETVLDIGCGSGILALSALLMGAECSYGIDIDEEAVAHARSNAAINHLEKRAHFSRYLPKKMKTGIILINMILTEQKTVLGEIPLLPQMAKLWIASGLLASQRKEAIDWMEGIGFQLIEEKTRGDWLGLKWTRRD
jgi:ribosomal protein L11 methyltransferase